MIKIESQHKLKHAPREDLVYVITTGKLYRSIDGEWVEKVYFSSKETAQILGITQHKVRLLINALGLRTKMRSSKLSQAQLRLIAQAAKRLNNKQTYSEIRKEMRL